MSAFEQLVRAVQADANCNNGPYVYQAIARMARDLCDKTYCWKDEVRTASMETGVNTITLTVPTDADIVAIEYLSFDGRELTQTSERELSMLDFDWRVTVGDPTHVFTVIRERKARVYPTPNRDLADAFKYALYLKPKPEATTVAEFICEQFDEVLRNGALYEILKMPGRPWSNPEMAAHYRGRYRQGVYEARDKTVRMYASQNLFVIPEALF